MKMAMKLNVKKFFLTIFGSIIIAFLLYTRVYTRAFTVRLPKDLRLFFIENEVLLTNFKITFIAFSIILINLIIIYVKIKNYAKEPETSSNWVILRITRIYLVFKDAVILVYDKVVNLYLTMFVGEGNLRYNFFEKKCFYLFYNYNNFTKYIIVYDLLPRVLICISLFIDVFIYFKLILFYKSLILLIIPMFVKVIIFTLEDFTTLNTSNLEKRISKKSFYVTTINEYHEITIKDPKDPLHITPKALTATVEKYRNLLSFKEYFMRYNYVYIRYNFWITIMISSFLITVWFYILAYNYYVFYY